MIETLRPLPVERLAGAPSFVLGVSILRGASVPVLDVDALLQGTGPGAEPLGEARRFVSLKTGHRNIALAVQEVVGVRSISSVVWNELPPLLDVAREDLVELIAVHDGELLALLGGARWLHDPLCTDGGEALL